MSLIPNKEIVWWKIVTLYTIVLWGRLYNNKKLLLVK